ncbi:energy transducer TonB [Mariniphaga sediminis]|uniref:energy transducer TonB n=1 Tax=Mariniphaga sediminis TaxID=1628158 RepID=UPI0035681898
METKKTNAANLENKRNLFFLIGLVIALGFTLLAFEWSVAPKKAESLGTVQFQPVAEEMVPITREPEAKLPPPKVVEILNIVEDHVDIDDEILIEDSEANDETVIDFTPVIFKNTEEPEREEKIFIAVDDPAEFPGGDRALYKYISDQVRYPVVAQENGIQGKVFVKFVVNEVGMVSNAEILRGVDISLDQEALRVVNSLPKFKPGRQQGRAVKVYYSAVINFQLQ